MRFRSASVLRPLSVLAFALALACSGCHSSGTAFNPPGGSLSGHHIYVGNDGSANAVDVFSTTATNNVAPNSLSITGSNTELCDPHVAAFDGSGKMYVTDPCFGGVLIYAAGASGNATPVATIGSAGFWDPAGIAIDSSGTIYIANDYDNDVLEFAAGSSGGNVTPLKTLTGVNCPNGLALFGTTVYVTDECTNAIYVFAGGSTTPTTTIVGVSTTLSGPHGVAVDATGDIYVANAGNGSILVFPPSASNDVAPLATISGGTTGLEYPNGLALYDGKIYVADNGANAVLVFSETANGDPAPLQEISGSNTTFSDLHGLTIH